MFKAYRSYSVCSVGTLTFDIGIWVKETTLDDSIYLLGFDLLHTLAVGCLLCGKGRQAEFSR